MSSPPFIAAGAVTQIPAVGAGGTANVPSPAGIAAGDLVLLFIIIQNNTDAGGGTMSITGGSSFGTQLAASIDPTQFNSGIRAYAKIAGGSEPSNYVCTWTGAGAGSFCSAWTMIYRGVDPAAAINVAASSSPASSTNPAFPSITSTVAATTWLGVMSESQASAVTITVHTGDGTTQRVEDHVTFTDRCFNAMDKAIVSAGVISGLTADASPARNFNAIALAIASATAATQKGRRSNHSTGTRIGSRSL